MSDEETLQKRHEESDSEEEEDQLDDVPDIDIDVTKLTPLSPEVISKQVSKQLSFVHLSQLTDDDLSRLQLTWVRVVLRGETIQQLNICTGTIGHVAHGKSTVVKAISGVMTVRFKNELVRNITIKLGYANAKVRSFPISYGFIDDRDPHRRSTSAKTRRAHAQAAIGRTVQTRKIIRPANDQDAVTE